MPIFGQVWLWSSLAFLLGAFLCWALVARPARRRVGELEEELTGRHRRQPMSERPEPARHRALDALDDEYDRYEAQRGGRYGDRSSLLPEPIEEQPEPLTRAYALPTREPGGSNRPGPLRSSLDGIGAPPEVDRTDTELADGPETTQYLAFSAGSLGTGKLEAPPEVPSQPEGRGWFDSEAEQRGEPLEAISRLQSAPPGDLDRRLVDDEADAPPAERGGTIFTQHTHPIPGDMIRQIDEAGKAARADEPADALVDDLADEDAGSRAEQTLESEPAATPGASLLGMTPGPEVTSQPRPDAEPTGTAPAYGAQGQTEVMPAATFGSPTEVAPASGQGSGVDTSRRGADEPKIMPGITTRPEPASSNPLPKRVPGKPRGHTPFGVQTAPAPEPADTSDAAAEPSRALFEPIVPAEDDNPVVPPPHRLRGGGNGAGPYGPGSAMPLPSGASPSPEFTIKASVTARRYCTPESPQFGRTVAEVWFKSSADAERVGFRPVS